MPNVFEGTPDARQSEQSIPVSRFRPRYRTLSAGGHNTRNNSVDQSYHED